MVMLNQTRQKLINQEGLDIKENHATNDVKKIEFVVVFGEDMVSPKSISFEAVPETQPEYPCFDHSYSKWETRSCNSFPVS
jgi:hypothetical protein